MSIEQKGFEALSLNLTTLTNKTKAGIRSTFQSTGLRLVKTSKNLIDTTKRAPWSYLVKINGRYVRHHPSLPRQPAAEMTGKLKESIRFTVRESELIFGAGNKFKNKRGKKSVHYARFVEEGTRKMKARPYLKPAIKKEQSDAYRDFIKYLEYELK